MASSSSNQAHEDSPGDAEPGPDMERQDSWEEASTSAEDSVLGSEKAAHSGEESNTDAELHSEGELDSEEGSDSEEESEESILTRRFPILNIIDPTALAAAAIEAELKHDSQTTTTLLDPSKNLTCVVKTPRVESCNVLFDILLSDDVKWIARVPTACECCLSDFGQNEAEALVSTLQTMRFISSRTSIPMPEIYTWQLDVNNPVGVPYQLESFVEGERLYDRWHGPWSGDEPTRIKVLRNSAKVMSQLHCLESDTIGSLDVSHDGVPSIKDIVKDNHDFDKETKTESTTTTFPPFKSTKAHLFTVLDHANKHPKEPHTCEHHKPTPEDPAQDENNTEVLCLAIDSIPQALDTPRSFLVGHPSFDFYSVYTNEDGDITGLTDWDGMEILCSCSGLCAFSSIYHERLGSGYV